MANITCVDSIVEGKSLLKHAFYQRWSKGELTKENLQEYAKEYYQLVIKIPALVASVLNNISEPELKAKVEENLKEEREHVALWEGFARSLDISREELLAHKPAQMTLDAIARLEILARYSLESGITTLYSLEKELAQIAATKKDGLTKFYGLMSEDAHKYFDEHLKEESHLEAWRNGEVNEVSARKVAAASMLSQNQILDSVCLACGIAMC